MWAPNIPLLEKVEQKVIPKYSTFGKRLFPNIPLLEKVEQKVIPKKGRGFAPLFLKVDYLVNDFPNSVRTGFSTCVTVGISPPYV